MSGKKGNFMNREEYEKLYNVKTKPSVIGINNLSNKKDRTLLYGYTCNRDTFHVYIHKGVLHKIIYNSSSSIPKLHESGSELLLENIVPDKRLYPSSCDYEFCVLLTEAGVYLPFTSWEFNCSSVKFDNKQGGSYFGKIVEENKQLTSF